MFLSTLKNLRKTIGGRLTFWYSGIFIVSVLLLFAFAYFLLSSSLKKQDHEEILLKLKELAAFYQTGGIPAVEREVTIEKKFEKQTHLFIRVSGGNNKTIFLILPYQWAEFDIKALEKERLSADEGWIRLFAPNSDKVLEIASVSLPNNYLLQVGKSSEYRQSILKQFRKIFTAVIVPLIFIGFVGGAFLGFRALKPVRNLIETIRSIKTGKVDARVPNPQSGDEMEELAKLFNEMLERIDTLINAMKGTMDNIAHDLRTPMSRLRAIAETALQSGGDSRICEEALVGCIEESEQILLMVKTLMDVSEAETGIMSLNLDWIRVSEMTDRVLDMYRYVAEEKNITVHDKIPEKFSIYVDPTRMSQTIANLLDNAIKYTPSGGSVNLEAHQSGDRFYISVSDNGIGIPPDETHKIWDRLYRCDQSRSQKGLGLGLSQVRAIVKAHKGEVKILSEPGKGSTFTISIPASGNVS